MRRIIFAFVFATLLIAAPAAAEEPADVVVTSSLCCLTADGAGPDTLTYSVMNTGDAAISGFAVDITLPPGTIGEPALEVWVIEELAPGSSTDLVIALSPDVQVLGTSVGAPVAAKTSLAVPDSPEAEPMLPAWLRIL